MKELQESEYIQVETESYYCYTNFIERIKRNYVKGFAGVYEQLKHISNLIKIIDPELFAHFRDNNIKIFHFAFRWLFCLLAREFPIYLSIKMMDYYITDEVS